MKGFDTTPKPAFLLAMQNQSWTVAGALSELVDNSFGPGRGNAHRVIITYDAKKRIIDVLDNGRGMDEIGRLFQLGNTIGRTPGDIGVYGSGGTMAVLWLAKYVEVWTLRDKKVSHDRVDWKKQIASESFPIITSEWNNATIGNVPPELLECTHGTMIRLALQDERNLSQSNVSNITRDLAATYSPALRLGRGLLWKTIGRNGGERTLADALPELSKPCRISGVLETESGEHLAFEGKIGRVEDWPQSKSVVSIGYGIRIIKTTRDCFVSPDSDEKYTGSGVCGYIDLGEGWQPYLSTTKNDINDAVVWDALMQHVFEEIRPLLREIQEEKLDLVLDDLCVQLTALFDGSGTLEVSVAKRPQGDDAGDSGKDGAEHRRKFNEEAPGEDRQATEPAATALLIVPQDDAQMDGALCLLEEDRSGHMVMVNKDHRDVAEALEAKQVNRTALIFLVAGVIASKAWRDEIFRKTLFRPKVLERIDQTNGGGEGLILRLLVDRVRRQPTSPESRCMKTVAVITNGG